MPIIVFNTSTAHLAIGIASEDGEMLREFHADASEGERGIHDARLALETAKLLAESGIPAREISRIGLIIGPGSFTGLRIGLSFAKGFCFAAGANSTAGPGLVPLTQHEVMAAESKATGSIYIVTPGYREDLFYIAKFPESKDLRLLNGAAISQLGNVPMLLHDHFLLHPSPFLPDTATYVSPSLATIARLTASSSTLLRDGTLDTLEPMYLTEFQASVERQR
ncbi:MAG TPA: tRNA (adenosine(37)-N6)-threonylcarbamoyltransferase complex dimerization subunit type 1 TsaB [Candidatus Kapabacteria bacterium]|nr:tRNA (adenosine(37)-N6)-threonylcarbamoyltransferase complex dimerization subunit type 1 TsaB [Candidatus Kapabacteria bacterium]